MATGNILIDTSIIIDHLRKQKKENSRLYEVIANPGLFVSTITLYELFAGAITERKMQDINDLVKLVTVRPFTREMAERAGEIYRVLRAKNHNIGVGDILIGATALVHHIPIMTLNQKHFKRIPGLMIF